VFCVFNLTLFSLTNQISFVIGFNNFGGAVKINSVSVAGATPHYVVIKLSVTLNSPSPVTINVGDIVFRTVAFGYDLGPTFLKQVTITQGDNTYDAEFQLTPTADPVQQGLIGKILSGYLMGGTFPLTVQGTSASSPILSLQEGLAGVKLATSITGVPPTLITSTKVVALVPGAPTTATTYVTMNNPLDVSFSLISLQAQIFFTLPTGTIQLAHINYKFGTPFTVGAKQAATTPGIPLVFDIPLLDLLPLASLPVININIVQNATVVVGQGFVGILAYSQNNVPAYLDPFSPAVMAAVNSASNTTSTQSGSLNTVSVTVPTFTGTTASPVATSDSATSAAPPITTTTSIMSATTTTTTTTVAAVQSVPV
jgi:hypothetical protein